MTNQPGESSSMHHGLQHASRRSARRGHAALWVAAVTCISVSYTPAARGANKTWIGNAGSYATDANWSPSGVPTFTDVIQFPPASGAIVLFPSSATSFAVAGLLERGGAFAEL